MDHATVDVTDGAFAIRFGAVLREHRRERGMRLRHLADRGLSRATLREVEQGRCALNPVLVSRLAALYGLDLDDVLPPREPLVLLATGTIAAGGEEESFEPGDCDSVVAAYLRLISRLRGKGPHEAITLRRDDLIDIADQLGRPRTEIVDRVAALMGASEPQRRAMVELYLNGASVLAVA